MKKNFVSSSGQYPANEQASMPLCFDPLSLDGSLFPVSMRHVNRPCRPHPPSSQRSDMVHSMKIEKNREFH